MGSESGGSGGASPSKISQGLKTRVHTSDKSAKRWFDNSSSARFLFSTVQPYTRDACAGSTRKLQRSSSTACGGSMAFNKCFCFTKFRELLPYRPGKPVHCFSIRFPRRLIERQRSFTLSQIYQLCALWPLHSMS